MFVVSKFIYDLTGRPEPTQEELDDELDRLLLAKSAEKPTHLVSRDDREQINHQDSEVICAWLRRRFEPALVMLMFDVEYNNWSKSKRELCKMEPYSSIVDRWLRAYFVHRHGLRRTRELCFDFNKDLKLETLVERLKRTLSFLSHHLMETSPTFFTLQNTDAFTEADVMLYNYLKRILVGKYANRGLETHVRLCEPLIKFMDRYARKNPHIINVTTGDPLAETEASSIVREMTKPAMIALGVIFLCLWRNNALN